MRYIPKRPVPASVVVAVTVALLGDACVTAMTGWPKNPTSVKQVEDKVREGVPLGSSRGEVETWLKSQPIEFGYHNGPTYSSSLNDAGLDPDALGGLVQAIIRHTDRSLLIEGSISIYFFFGKDGRTVKHLVKWVGTGP